MSALSELEAALADATGRTYAVSTGRGAGAIWIALEVLSERSPEKRSVILPATLCTSPPAVTRFAGLVPRFCDVDPATGNMDPAALKVLLDAHPDTLCVIAAHLYGQPCEMISILKRCRQAGVVCLEDAAQAWGATVDGQPVGSFGDLSIVSFGHTKILDAGGGGAVLTDDADLVDQLRVRVSSLRAKPVEAAEWEADYRAGYYALAPLFNARPGLKPLIGKLSMLRPELYRYRLDDAQARRVLDTLSCTQSTILHRRAMAELYEETLSSHAEPLVRQPGGVPWRFCMRLAPEVRDSVVQRLRAKGFDASTWYPCVPSFFMQQPATKWPGAKMLEETILNLWVDDGITEERVRVTSRFINEVMAGVNTSWAGEGAHDRA